TVGAGMLLYARCNSQDAAVLAPRIFRLRGEEGTDVEANAVIDVGLPANRLLIERLPPHENIVGWLALDDLRQLAAQVLCRNEALLRASFAGRNRAALGRDPFPQVAVTQLLEQAAAGAVPIAKSVIVDERREAAAHPVPDVPDERRL